MQKAKVMINYSDGGNEVWQVLKGTIKTFTKYPKSTLRQIMKIHSKEL